MGQVLARVWPMLSWPGKSQTVWYLYPGRIIIWSLHLKCNNMHYLVFIALIGLTSADDLMKVFGSEMAICLSSLSSEPKWLAHVTGSGVSRVWGVMWAELTICYVSSVSRVLTGDTCDLLPVRAQAGESERVGLERRGIQSCEKHHEDTRVMTVSDDDDEQWWPGLMIVMMPEWPMMTRAMMSRQLLIIAAGLACVQGVSVDPDMMESFMDDIPLQAESEDVFIFPSMRVNPLNLVRSSTRNVLTLDTMRPTTDVAPFCLKNFGCSIISSPLLCYVFCF